MDSSVYRVPGAHPWRTPEAADLKELVGKTWFTACSCSDFLAHSRNCIFQKEEVMDLP